MPYSKIIKWSLFVLALLAVVYLVLTSIPRYSVDKSVLIEPPLSVKSAPGIYRFGYQPGFAYSEARQSCAQRYQYKKAFFGDLHIHTALSADAFPDGTRIYPDDVYRFARGQRIAIPSPANWPQRFAQLRRPLDFAAVTDHAETFGEGYICRNEGEFAGYDSKECKVFRNGGEIGVRQFMVQNAMLEPNRKESVCGVQMQDCEAADALVWQQVIDSAQRAYDDSSACQFTSFVGYEYTRSPNAMHLHRNTIFKNVSVPQRPASFFSHPGTYDLLSALEEDCRLSIAECDAISIPHNSNISGGNAFSPREAEGFSPKSQQALAALRNAFDRLMEITQHKGASECLNGVTDILGDVDELCDVEALRQFGKRERVAQLNVYLPKITYTDSPECSDAHFSHSSNLYGDFCLSSRDYARGALLEGLLQADALATNPHEFGFIGSSDTHIGLAGAVDESNWQGHIAYETTLQGRLGKADTGRFNRLVSNPGGLAGVYAVENSRDALFHSMKRRETFATSGPRIEPRFFVGHFPPDICLREDWLAMAYKNGTPMGSSISAQTQAVQFLLQARRDPLSNPLQKLQLVKGWVDEKGKKYNRVIDISSDVKGDTLCAVYEDQGYRPEYQTYYYLRVVEKLSDRWSTAQCNEMPEEQKPAECDNNQPRQINEMAWTSPIWLGGK